MLNVLFFPKGKTTWEGFHRPFKDGDIAISDRGGIHLLRTANSSYCAYREYWKSNKFDKTITTSINIVRLANEKEKAKLFDVIKEHGYKWNPDTKTLERLIVPKFKVGDKIKHKLTGSIYKVLSVLSNEYGGGVYNVAVTNEIGKDINIEAQDNYELVPDKFDINTLKPFDKVLVRDDDNFVWQIQFFDKYNKKLNYPFICLSSIYKQCIPYKNNEHLRDTTNSCTDYYKIW